jgi:hypothetical protein
VSRVDWFSFMDLPCIQDTQRDYDLHQVDISVRSMAGAKEHDR